MKFLINLDAKSAFIREICGRLRIVCMLCIGYGYTFSIVEAADSPFVGSQTCNSVSCHGRTEPRRVSGGGGSASLHEFLLYERYDPHAKAAKTLVSPEFQAIVHRLSERKEDPSSAEVYRQCAQCHDPEGIVAAGQSSKLLVPLETGHGMSLRGIQCESCHGGAKDWLVRHYERDVSRSSLLAAGMRDTKSLQVRGQLCASCHVGGEERNVNHDMLAAGHPPLRFELAAYHRKLTSHDEAGKQSHWNDARERRGTKDFEVQLWEAGQIASAHAALSLLEGRAHRASLTAANDQSAAAPWPEFAEYNCFSCHQRLPKALAKEESTATKLDWGEWNIVLASLAADAKGLNTLRTEMKSPFASQPADVAVQARSVRLSLPSSLFRDDMAGYQLLEVLEHPRERAKSWDALCQRYLAQRVVEKSIGDEFQKRALAGGDSTTPRKTFDEQRAQLECDLAVIAERLGFPDASREWPQVLKTEDGVKGVESSLTATAGKLRKLQKLLELTR